MLCTYVGRLSSTKKALKSKSTSSPWEGKATTRMRITFNCIIFSSTHPFSFPFSFFESIVLIRVTYTSSLLYGDLMLPELIMHNSISLDGSLTGFTPNMKLHYDIVSTFEADARLIGSQTAHSGITQFLSEIPKEKPEDCVHLPSQKNRNLPYWILVDSRGVMEKKLHVIRGFEFCHDVIVLISSDTPNTYIEYLKSRAYDYIQTGKHKVDLPVALEQLNKRFSIKKIVTDCGETLNSILIMKGLVTMISLLITPVLVGQKKLHFLKSLKGSNLQLQLISCTHFDNDFVGVIYKLMK